MSKMNYARKKQRFAGRMVMGGISIPLIGIICLSIYCFIKADEIKDKVGFLIFAIVIGMLVCFFLRDFFPAKKRRATVQDKGVNGIGRVEQYSYIYWVDVKIKNKIKRWYLEDEDLYNIIKRGNTYIFFLKRRTAEKIKEYKENVK